MDATQVINYSTLESDEEEKNEEEKPKPLAKLCILKNDHIPERDFPLFIGDNVLGRDADTCALPLPAPSVSKQHATICISVHRRRGSSSRADIEALVWDLGSMNGTRKGRLKLTPNVRYALSDGDRLSVADIPCQFVGWEGRGTPESLKVDASGSTQASAVVALFGEAQNSPVQNSCLSFEKTPVQVQGTLVAESDLDSDGESQGHREGRRKSLDSSSDSSKPSATCSTFLSPSNKIVPESEDESPITPSSSTRKKPCRYVSFSEEEPDINAGRQQFENKTSPATVDDSDKGEGAVVNGQTPGGTRLEEKKHGALDQHRFIREESLPRVSKSSAIPVFNMDSDTDVEDADDDRPLEETDRDVSHDAPKVDLAPPVLPDDFQLDSDIDVDEGADTSRDKTLSRLDLKMSDLSETDDDQGSAFNTHPDVRGSSNNHGPTAAISTDITIAAAESDVDTDVDESNVPPAGGGQDSDTDMEDQIPSLPDIKTPGLNAQLLENCSTPVQENDVEEMETQAFLTPSQGPFKCAIRRTAFSSCSDDLEHEDVIVAETQPFNLQTRVQVHCDNSDTSPPSEPVSSSEETEEVHSAGPSFQLGLSDSSHLQSHAHALAMENTEAFVPVSVEATQEYGTPYHHRDDLNIEDTQAYAEPAKSPVRQVELALQETQAYISEPYNESEDDLDEETQPLDGTSFSANLVLAQALPALMAEPSSNNFTLLQTQGQISMEADLSEEHEEEAGETCNETGSMPENQPVCTIEFYSIPVLLKNKAMPQQLEKETQPLISGDFSVGNTQSIGTAQTQSTPTSVTKESDGEGPIPGLVQLQNETQSITTIAVDKQPIATSDDDEGDSEDSIPILHQKRKARPLEETQPLMSCDFPVAEPQPITTCDTVESDDEDLIPSLHKGKVRLQKETQPIATSSDLAVEVQSMTEAAIQPMATSDHNKTNDDDESIAVLCNKKKEKPLQLEETQLLIGGDFPGAETQPIAASHTDESDNENRFPVLIHLQKETKPIMTSNDLAGEVYSMTVSSTTPMAFSENEESDDEDSIPVLHIKRKARPLHLEDETQPLIACDFSVAGTQPIGTSPTDESDNQNHNPVLVHLQKETKPIITSNDLAGEVHSMTVSSTTPMAFSENEESDDEDSIPVLHIKRKARPLHIEDESQPLIACDFSVDGNQPMGTSPTDERDNENHNPVLVHLQKDANPTTTSNKSAVEVQAMTVAATQPIALSENEESDVEDLISLSHNELKNRLLHIEENTQPLISCSLPIAETQPMPTCQTGENDDEDPNPALNEKEVKLPKETQPITTSKSLDVEVQQVSISATQPMATSDSEESKDESITVLPNERKVKPVQLEEETKPLIGRDISLAQTQPTAASHTDESDNDNIIPILVHLQKDTKPITTLDNLAVEMQPITEAATQPMTLSENGESDDENSIPVSPTKTKARPLKLEKETQPLIGCDVPVAKTQLIATCYTEESDDEDPIPALDQRKVQLQKETQLNTTFKSLSVEVQHMTTSATQPMATSDSDESDDESMAVSLNKRKAKPLQLEEETKHFIGCHIPLVKSQPIDARHTDESDNKNLTPVLVRLQKEMKPFTTSNDLAVEVQPMTVAATQPMALSDNEESVDEDLIPVSLSKRLNRPLLLEEETQPFIGCDFPVAETQPIATCHTEESLDEDPIPALNKGKVQLQKETQPGTTSKSLAEEVQHVTISTIQPMPTSDLEESDDKSMAVLLNKTKEKPLQLEEETQPLIGCNIPVVETSAVSHTDESDSENLIPVLVHLQKEMKPITTSNDSAVEVQPMTVAATQLMALSENEESDDEHSIPVSHYKTKAGPLHLEKEKQPLIGCDFTVAETQVIATCRTHGSDDEDPIPAVDKIKVQLQKEIQPNTTFKSLSVEVQHMTISATQPMATSDSDESDDESMAVSLNKRKEKTLQLEEDTQTLIGCNFPIVETLAVSHTDESDSENRIPVLVHLQKEMKPITTSDNSAVEVQPMTIAATQPMELSENEEGDDKDSHLVSNDKTKARPLHLEEEILPLIGCDFPVAETQPITTCHTDESDDEDPIPALDQRKVQLQKETQLNTTFKSLSVEVQHMTTASTQPMATSDSDESDNESMAVPLNKRKEKQLHFEENTKSLIGCNFPVVETQRIASHTDESDNENLIPVLVHLQKETNPITTSTDSAVEVQPMTVAATQLMALSENEEGDHKDSIPVSHNKIKARPLHLEEETQPLIGCDILVAETQPTATYHTEESDEKDPVPASNKRKVQLQKETQPNTTSKSLAVEEKHMITCAIQPMASSDPDETDDEDPIMYSQNKKKTMSQHLEKESQPLIGCDFSVTNTKPIAVSHTDESDSEIVFPVSVHLPKETKPISAYNDSVVVMQSVTVAVEQPVVLSKDEESDDDDSILVPHRKRKAGPLKLEETQSLISCDFLAAETQPTATSQTKGIVDNDPIPTLSKIKIQLLKETQPFSLNVATTQIMAASENEVSHVDCIRKENLLQETRSLNSTVEVSDISNPKGQSEDGDKDLRSCEDEPSIAPRKTQEKEPETLEISALGDVLRPSQEKEEFEVSSAISQPMDTCEDEEADSEIFIPGQRRNKVKPLQFEDETQSLVGSQSQSTKNEPGPSLQKETLNEVGTSSSIVGCSRTTKECEEEEETQKRQTRSKKARQKSVKSSPGRASEKEAMMQHTKDQQRNDNENQSIQLERLESKSNKEERHETEKREKEAKERRQKEIAEREKEERLQATKEQEIIKKERTDLEIYATERQTQNEEEKPKVPRRGRRATRRTIGAAAELELEDCPAMRTRSRSNSSNSINSEVSALSTQESQGRGRRVNRFNGPAKATTSRRQTVASGNREPPEQDIVGVSRSSSSNSLASEMSCSSLGSRSRGRRGRKRGRGGKTESGPSWFQPVFSPNPSPRPTTRSRSGWKAAVTPSENDCEMPDVKPAFATRRRRRAGVNEPTTAEQSNQEDQSAGEGSPLPKRTFRRRKVKSEAVEASVDSLGNDHKEVKEDKGKGRKRELEAGEAKDDTLAPVRAKRRGTVARPNPLDTASEDGSVASVSSAVEVTEPQTPIGSKSRKRKAFVGASPGIYGDASPSTSCQPQSVEQFYKVLFTGVVDAAGEKVLARLGGALAKGTSDMNCLVTDKVRRTVKFLCAVAKGVPIVTTHWLEKSGKAGSFLPPDAFIVKDPEQEKKFSFCLKESLRLSSSHPLLQGYEIHITKSVKPEPIHMKDIIACSGATFLSKMPSSHKPQTIVISCEEDWPLCRAAVSASLPLVSAEFILSGILQHKLDFDTHKLSGPSDHLQPTPSRRGRGSKKS
ncbi:mediator of DNA damage checkpoint protein 1 [Nerophis ophidion]|uniref:mediator of DNA damage checkpoint protein 1 n=1 Tax=Nerophis ophidion TaxID=159077 RepID=UPI002AE000A1|nr:mediator of DNA damage checkpoint protein 1 [Nerophis ophidion]